MKKIPLAILSRIESCVTLCLNHVGRGYDCASIIDSNIAKGISLFPRFFCMVHPYIHPYSNDFCTSTGHIGFADTRIRMHTCVALRLYHVLV